MNTNANYSVKSRGGIITLSVFSLLFYMLSFAASGLRFVASDKIGFSVDYRNVIFLALTLIGVITFIVSVASRKRAAVIGAVAYGIIAITFFIRAIFYLIYHLYLFDTFFMISFIIFLLLALLYGVSVISALTGYRVRALAVLAGALGLAGSIVLPVFYLIQIDLFSKPITSLKYMIFEISAVVFWYIALLLLSCAVLTNAARNRVPAVMGKGKSSAPAPAAPAEEYALSSDPDSPEAKLAALAAKLEFGIITQEEYDAKRAEIINSL